MACRMFRSRIDNILKYIFKGDSHPIGFLVDWWFRIEFQNRGSLHVHAILWALLYFQMGEKQWWDGDELCNLVAGLVPSTEDLIEEFSKLQEGAKIIVNSDDENDECNHVDISSGDSGEEKTFFNKANCKNLPVASTENKKEYTRNCRALTAKIIDPYISGCVPSNDNFKPTEQSNLKPIPMDSLHHASLTEFNYEDCTVSECEELKQMLASVNLHAETHRKSCFKGGRKNCRANFPRGLREKTVVKFVKLKGSKIPTLRAMPKRNHVWVNDYNGWTILHHRGNMDIQFICNPYGTATYCCMYSSKAEAPDQTLLTKTSLKC